MYGPQPAAQLCNEKNGAVSIEDSDGSILVSGELFEHRVRNLCANERLRTIAVVFCLILFAV